MEVPQPIVIRPRSTSGSLLDLLASRSALERLICVCPLAAGRHDLPCILVQRPVLPSTHLDSSGSTVLSLTLTPTPTLNLTDAEAVLPTGRIGSEPSRGSLGAKMSWFHENLGH